MANMPQALRIAKGEQDLVLLPRMTNRHGLVAGATGTGKTVTLQVIAENLSKIGVPVFMADVKGDLSGVSQPGTEKPKISERIQQLGIKDFTFSGCPVSFWDVFGNDGLPVRATVSDMGPLLFSRLLNLNETQSGVLTLVFKIADDNRLLLLDLKDLRAIVQYVGDNAKQFKTDYGNITPASIGAIQRGLVTLEEQGGDKFFGEPALDLNDIMRVDSQGNGMISILAADKLFQSPKVYTTFLLWLLSELFEKLPEVGDVDKPKLVFFFDEAHLLFNDAPQALLDKIEQVVRLIRSKGVGIFFVTQNPIDIPDSVLGQLGNRVQHALRAFSARDKKAVKAAAETFRENPALDAEQALTELGVGEALVSFLDEKGIPGIVQRAFVFPPHSQIGPITPEQRQQLMRQSPLAGHYEQAIDRDSAYEILRQRASEAAAESEPAVSNEPAPKATRRSAPPPSALSGAGDVAGAFAKTAARAVGSQVGRELVRGVLGSLLGGAAPTVSRRRKR